MTDTIECMYSCHKCRLSKVKINVPVRGAEDVITWMNQTAVLMADDHFRRSPHCKITKIDEVFIPTTGRSNVGGPVVN